MSKKKEEYVVTHSQLYMATGQADASPRKLKHVPEGTRLQLTQSDAEQYEGKILAVGDMEDEELDLSEHSTDAPTVKPPAAPPTS